MSDDDHADEDEGHALGMVMPFLPVTSKGGPYDDDAYAAGWECGQIAALLEYSDEVPGSLPIESRLKLPVRTANVDQLDLVAMQHGFVIDQREPWEDGSEWTFVRFAKTEG